MLILASQSPRRKSLLASLGVSFEVMSSSIDESTRENERPEAYVLRLATAKAGAILPQVNQAGDVWILGSDTAVVIGDTILGKPVSYDDFKRMMQSLSGQTHRVLTSIALVSATQCFAELVETKVTFSTLSAVQIDAYWKTGEPQDKAGGYGIQGLGSVFVERIEGSYSAVVGLPLHETAKILSKAHVSIWDGGLSLST